MNVVTLMGSPRSNGNSSTIAKSIAKTAADLGAQTRSYELNRLSYRGCQACYACKGNHEECVIKDDLSEVLAAVKEADLVVLASPVYYGDISSQLKGFMDRTFSYLVPDYHSNPQPSRLAAKKLIFVLTQGHPDQALFADIFARYQSFLSWQGFTEVRLVRACGIGPGRGDGVPGETIEEAQRTLRELVAQQVTHREGRLSMTGKRSNFSAEQIGPLEDLLQRDFMGFHGKYFIGENLGLTGCEVSLNRLPAGKKMPFVHAHTKNEELYIVLRGKGTFFVDGEEFPIQEGSLVRVAPEGERAWRAGDEDLYFICIQAQEGSLSRATLEDGFRLATKASWM